MRVVQAAAKWNKGTRLPPHGKGGDSRSPNADENDQDKKLEEQLTNEKLVKLEQIFEEADQDKGGGLDMDEFRNAMRLAMGDHLTDQDMDALFMKVDTNCDGTVDWDEYLSYMLLEYQEKDHMNFMTQEKTFPSRCRVIPDVCKYQRFNDNIVQIIFMPDMQKNKSNLYVPTADESHGKYCTVTKEGTVNFWTGELSHLRGFKAAKITQSKAVGIWVVDLVYLSNLNMLVIATTSATIAVFNTKGELTKRITELEISPTCLDFWVDPNVSSNCLLMWGDARGNISALKLKNCLTVCFLQPTMNKQFQQTVSFNDLLKAGPCGVTAYKLKIHDDFVMKVKYVPSLNCFLSCCQMKKTAVYMGDLETRKATYFHVRKGVLDFDYSPLNNLFVTGGKDTVLRVWNPYVTVKPVMLFQGHNSAITHIAVNDTKEQVISISLDKEVHVYSLTSQTCIQTIVRKWVPLGSREMSAVCFNWRHQALLMATNQLIVFEHKTCEIRTLHLTSHKKPINVILYNSLFNQIVSGGTDSLVSVWDPKTGERLMQFSAHTIQREGGEIEEVEITAMNFDPTLRRLITAGQDGCIKVWNFNNGALLRQLPRYNHTEVTSLVCTRGRILAAGWNQAVNVYIDHTEDETMETWTQQHDDDVLAMALMPPSMLASCAFDGSIYLWHLETGHVVIKINAELGVRPEVTSSISGVRHKALSPLRTAQSSRNTHSVDSDRPGLHPTPEGEEVYTFTRLSRNIHSAKQNRRSIQVEHSPLSPITTNLGRSPIIHEHNSLPELKENRSQTKSKSAAIDAAVEALLFLDCRYIAPTTASLVACGALGWVRFWSVHPEGGLLGQFNASHRTSDSIMAMTKDELCDYLVTGDAVGYIKVWYVANYCVDGAEPLNVKDMIQTRCFSRFPLLTGTKSLRKKLVDQSIHPQPNPCTDPHRTHVLPILLTSFRGHLQTITSLEFISTEEQIISCSIDCSIRLFSITGEFMGIFGQETPWNPLRRLALLYETAADESPSTDMARDRRHRVQSPEPTDHAAARRGKAARAQTMAMMPLRRRYALRRLPADVRRVASAATLRVFYGGQRPFWRLAKNIVNVWVPMIRRHRRAMENVKAARLACEAAEEYEKKKDTNSDDEQASQEAVKEESEEVEEKKEPDVSENKTESDSDAHATANRPSPILGKCYKKTRRHQLLPTLCKPRTFHHQVRSHVTICCSAKPKVSISLLVK